MVARGYGPILLQSFAIKPPRAAYFYSTIGPSLMVLSKNQSPESKEEEDAIAKWNFVHIFAFIFSRLHKNSFALLLIAHFSLYSGAIDAIEIFWSTKSCLEKRTKMG